MYYLNSIKSDDLLLVIYPKKFPKFPMTFPPFLPQSLEVPSPLEVLPGGAKYSAPTPLSPGFELSNMNWGLTIFYMCKCPDQNFYLPETGGPDISPLDNFPQTIPPP